MDTFNATNRVLMCCAAWVGLTAAVPASAQAPELQPVILADSNRDGVIDDADLADKTAWTPTRGAILLPNIGDKSKRCPGSSAKGWSDARLEACNDAEGNVARAPEYFAPVRTRPLVGLSAGASGHVVATGPGADKIRVFVRRKEQWRYLAATDRLAADELKQGAVLGVDSRDVIRDASVWDGRATLEFVVTDRGRTMSDRVAMRLAPIVIHHPLEPAVEVFAPQSGRTVAHQQFMTDLSAVLSEVGFGNPIHRFNTTDNWAQDFVEFGHVSMPAPDGVTSLRIALRSPQPGRSAGRSLFDIRGPGMGVVQIGGDGYHQVDSFGNLETIPPYELHGKSFPVGRVIYGDAGDGIAPHKDFVTFFRSQAAQDPITLDTSWLAIGHVDEFVQFVPADNRRGWTIAVKDVPAALALLREAQKRGHGTVSAFSREGAPQRTIDDLLSDQTLLQKNEAARRKIELNLDILKTHTGVTDDEIIRVPGLFHPSEFSGDGDGESAPPSLPDDLDWPREKIVYGPGDLVAYYPASVNGLLLDRDDYIVPRQWGPVLDGIDIMQAEVDHAYAKVGIKAWSVDDWLSHHRFAGEIHCGTNVTRQITGKWWQ